MVDDQILTDLCYVEDSTAHVDMNVIATEGGVVEIQGTGESGPFSREQLNIIDAGDVCADTRLSKRITRTVAWDPSHLNFLGFYDSVVTYCYSKPSRLRSSNSSAGCPLADLSAYPSFVMPPETGDSFCEFGHKSDAVHQFTGL